jgi:hypothetical protein
MNSGSGVRLTPRGPAAEPLDPGRGQTMSANVTWSRDGRATTSYALLGRHNETHDPTIGTIGNVEREDT